LTGGTSSLLDILRFFAFVHRGLQNIQLYHAGVQDLLGVQAAFSYGSGRMGLLEILRALSIGEDDEVILPGYTCIVMPAAIMRAGARPIYVDIDEDTLNMNVEAVKSAITSRTRAILVQHTFGIPCDLERLQHLATKYSIHIIEDGAHALGAKYKGIYCGNLGVAAVFSTEKSKMLSTDRGGLVTTNDLVLAERLRSSYYQLPFDDYKRTRKALTRWIIYNIECHPRTGEVVKSIDTILRRCWHAFDQKMEGVIHYDADEYEAAMRGEIRSSIRLAPSLTLVGLCQLRRLEKDVLHRNYLAKQLISKAAEFGWEVPEIDWVNTRPSFVRFPFLVDDRDRWIALLHQAGIRSGTWLNHPVHPEGSDFEACGYKKGMCPVAEKVSKRILNIPVHLRTGMWMIESIERVLRKTKL
jgi:dTDP-4-amino-4,6-dideoxygalactose transaminase